jgi:hypothetical protein
MTALVGASRVCLGVHRSRMSQHARVRGTELVCSA